MVGRQIPNVNKTRRLLLKAVGETVLLILCVAPGLFYSFKSLQSPWTASRIARARLSLQDQRIAKFVTPFTGYSSEHIGGEMVQTALLDATVWPSESIALLPIGSLLLALLYYAISRNTSRSPWTAAAITLYASWYYPRLGTQFSTNTYTWTNVLFLSFLILILYWLRHRTLILSTLIVLVFTATFLHYHTTPLWMIAVLIVAVAAMKLKEDHKKTLRTTTSWTLPLFCIVLYSTFDTVVYGNGLVRFRTEAVNELFIQSSLKRIIAPLLNSQPDVLDAFEIVVLSPRVATRATLLVLLLLTIPTGVWCVIKASKAIFSRDLGVLVRTRDDIFVWAVIIAAIVHALMYSLYGAFSTRVIPLAFPLILPLVTREFKLADRLEPILASGLAVLAVVGFLGYAPTLLPDTIASETGAASKLFRAGDRLLGDANVYASLLLNAVEDGKVIDLVWLDSDKYASVVGQRPVARDDFDYVVVDMSNNPMISLNWVFFEPWTQHLLEINQNNNLNKIYDSENLQVFQPTGAELSNFQLVPKDVNAVSRSLPGDSFRLFLSIIALAFVPGAVFVFIAHRSSIFRVDDISTLIGLAVGLSIAFITFVGYITNFTPLGLGWFVPLSVIVPWVVLGIYLIIRRPRFRVESSWVIYGASLIITLLIWSLLSTGVARARTQRRAEFTELFVTQPHPQSRSLAVNVVNRLNQSADFTIVFELDGVEVQTVGPQLLAPNSSWTEKWRIPSTSMDKRVLITLEKGGIPYRELHLSELGN
jgi:hypothetical protein